MTDERDRGEEPPEGSDDLFEDLDTFFKPIEDLDAEEAPPLTPPSSPTSEPAEPSAELTPDEEDEDDDEFLPSGWSAGLVTAGADPGASAGPGDEPPAIDMGDLFGPGEDQQPPLRTEPETPSFSLGEDLEEPSTESPALEPDADDAYLEATIRDDVIEPGPGVAPGPPRSTDEEQQEDGITLEELRSMPSVYHDLPGPDDESEEPPLFASPPAGGTAEIEAGADAEAEPPSEEELVAAADHFAESVGPSAEEVEQDLLADLDRDEKRPGTVRVGPEEETFVYPEEPAEPRGRVRVGAADPLEHGPSWQDSTGEEVEGPAPTPAGPGRNIPAALLVAAILALVAIATLWLGRVPFAFFGGLVILAAMGEFYAATMRGRRYHPATALGLVFGVTTLWAGYLHGEAAMGAMALLSLIFTFLWFIATPARARHNTLASIAITVMGVLYIPYLAGFALLLLAIPTEGRALLITVLALTFLNDAIAYAAGSFFGGHAIRRPLAATVSPRKSWEGTIVGAVGLALAGLVLLPILLDIFDGRPLLGLGFGVTIAVAGTFGDLAESLIKRDLRIKDMGTLFPGHGGALDRIDSVLFAAPAAYFFLRMFL